MNNRAINIILLLLFMSNHCCYCQSADKLRVKVSSMYGLPINKTMDYNFRENPRRHDIPEHHGEMNFRTVFGAYAGIDYLPFNFNLSNQLNISLGGGIGIISNTSQYDYRIEVNSTDENYEGSYYLSSLSPTVYFGVNISFFPDSKLPVQLFASYSYTQNTDPATILSQSHDINKPENIGVEGYSGNFTIVIPFVNFELSTEINNRLSITMGYGFYTKSHVFLLPGFNYPDNYRFLSVGVSYKLLTHEK